MLTDLTKKKWTLGRSIGTGGFGEIYLAQEGEGVNVRDDARSPAISIPDGLSNNNQQEGTRKLKGKKKCSSSEAV
jgi:hypothetical protein